MPNRPNKIRGMDEGACNGCLMPKSDSVKSKETTYNLFERTLFCMVSEKWSKSVE